MLSSRVLLLHGILFSVSFGLLEGTITATLSIAGALISPSDAAYAASLLYVTFSLTTLIAPAVVARAGAKVGGSLRPSLGLDFSRGFTLSLSLASALASA